jgi:hypothetical protein
MYIGDRLFERGEKKKKRVISGNMQYIYTYNVQIAHICCLHFFLSFFLSSLFCPCIALRISYELAYWSQREKRTSSLGGSASSPYGRLKNRPAGQISSDAIIFFYLATSTSLFLIPTRRRRAQQKKINK